MDQIVLVKSALTVITENYQMGHVFVVVKIKNLMLKEYVVIALLRVVLNVVYGVIGVNNV